MNQVPGPQKLDINILVTEVLNRMMRQTHLTVEAVTFIYHALQNYNELNHPPLETDSLPIAIEDPDRQLKPELKKKRTLEWVFKKAFEEFIVGLTESLIEAYKFIKFYNLAANSKIKSISSKDELDTALNKIERNALSLNFPTLIKEIEEGFNLNLLLKREILSVNQVRNCLVHRNAIVSEKDINDESKNCLSLYLIDLISLTEVNGDYLEIKWEHKKNGFPITNIGFQEMPREFNFSNGEKIILNQNIFNCATYTSVRFAQHLLAITHGIIEKDASN